jgi:hypothetical protein
MVLDVLIMSVESSLTSMTAAAAAAAAAAAPEPNVLRLADRPNFRGEHCSVVVGTAPSSVEEDEVLLLFGGGGCCE